MTSTVTKQKDDSTIASSAQAVKTALRKELDFFDRLLAINYLIGGNERLFSEEELYKRSIANASAEFCLLIADLVAKRREVRERVASERAIVRKEVDETIHQLLKDLGFNPRPSNYQHNRPAWKCRIPDSQGSTKEVVILGISNIFLDNDGSIKSIHARFSEHDNGSSDGVTISKSEDGFLRMQTPIDF